MESELTGRIWKFVSAGDGHREKGELGPAYDSYLSALYATAALVAYRETGRLMPVEELEPFLRVRHPGIYGLVRKYSRIKSIDGATVSALRDDVLELIGMMNLPSPEE